MAIFPLMLKDGAMTWYLAQSDATKTYWMALPDAFKEQYFQQKMNLVEAEIAGMVHETENRSVSN